MEKQRKEATFAEESGRIRSQQTANGGGEQQKPLAAIEVTYFSISKHKSKNVEEDEAWPYAALAA